MSRKIRILGPIPPPYGGVSVYVDRLRELLKGSGVKFWSYPYKAKTLDDVKFFRHRWLAIAPLLLRDGARARVFDCSHFHVEHPNPILLPIWLTLKELLRIEWVKAIHDGSLPARYRTFNAFQKALFRFAVRHVDGFVVVQDALREWLQEEVRASQRITVIPALLPDPHGTSASPMPADLKEVLRNYLRKAKRVCSIGAFIPDYGFDQIAGAIERLRTETDTDIGLLLLDGTFARDEHFRARVLEGREWIQVRENVPHEHVYAILRSIDLFVRGFAQESYGLSRVEAIQCGAPVVATDVGETRGMLTYQFGDVDALQNRIQNALFKTDSEQRQKFAVLFQREAEQNLKSLRSVLGLLL